MNIISKKTKPEWLQPPCSFCDNYVECEDELSPERRELWGNPHFTQYFNRCKYHPLFSSIENAAKCPYAHLVGQTAIEIICDKCGDVIDIINITDRRISKLLENKDQVDLCKKCKQKEDDEEIGKKIKII